MYYVVELKQSQINMPSASTNLPKAEEPGVLVVVYALCLPQSTYFDICLPQALRPSMARTPDARVRARELRRA